MHAGFHASIQVNQYSSVDVFAKCQGPTQPYECVAVFSSITLRLYSEAGFKGDTVSVDMPPGYLSAYCNSTCRGYQETLPGLIDNRVKSLELCIGNVLPCTMFLRCCANLPMPFPTAISPAYKFAAVRFAKWADLKVLSKARVQKP